MHAKLREIVASKKKRLQQIQQHCSLNDLKRRVSSRPETSRLYDALSRPGVSIVAEFKRHSPSAGSICMQDPDAIARMYAAAGAAAISVLTEEDYFSGSLADLVSVQKAVNLPVLRKDFIVDEYQIIESAVYQCDGILLIAAILSDQQLQEYIQQAHAYGIDPLVEVHTANELDRVMHTDARIIGINNRDLNTFTVDVTAAERLSRNSDADRLIVAESGINSVDMVHRYRAQGRVKAVLVGEYFLKAADIQRTVTDMVNAGID